MMSNQTWGKKKQGRVYVRVCARARVCVCVCVCVFVRERESESERHWQAVLGAIQL